MREPVGGGGQGATVFFRARGKIKAIQEDGPEFNLHFEDGSTVNMKLVDPGSSVAVRDKDNWLEYLG